MPSHTGHHIYRCAPATRNRAYPGGHVARQAAPVEEFIARLVIARLSRPDAADLVSAPAGGPDVAALPEEATAIRAAVTWQSLDLSRQRAVIKTLMTVTLHSPGPGCPPRVRPGHRRGRLAAVGRMALGADGVVWWCASSLSDGRIRAAAGMMLSGR